MENKNKAEREPSKKSDEFTENSAAETSTNDLKFDSRIPLDELKKSVERLRSQLHQVIVGQDDFIELLIVALLADGHVLIEGVPGIAKTLTAKLFAKTLKTDFNRIQFTPDLMPSDVLGTSILNAQKSDFEFKPGPIFSNIVLIDEINRSPAKTQAALFEVMEERQVTIDGEVHQMKPPFMVLATQNPIEQEGTYALPEAQLDRFIFKINITYPSLEDEVEILKTHHERKQTDPLEVVESVFDPEDIIQYRAQLKEILIEEKIVKYIAQIVNKTRNHPHLFLGASPRASLAIMNAAKAFAAISGRDFVLPEDVKKTLYPVLGHRIILSPEREMEGMKAENVIEMITKSIEIPR